MSKIITNQIKKINREDRLNNQIKERLRHDIINFPSYVKFVNQYGRNQDTI